ncbi:auxin-induced protein X15 [Gastrolobium bilobum]|uniref:auxin-induced protein X15 n=1 Tax=Gastrolobium bilobum TaxID=150636 RepID=UPI002AB2FB67|nr:auxin-induced protein X15 [Gastrolobium bilobum]
MAKLSIRIISSKKKGEGGIVKLKFVVEKLQKRLLLGRKNKSDSSNVPEDVKQGHFAVIAESGEEPKRFVMPLSCLSNPTFLKLLEEAEQEYGFDHAYDGALTIPCTPIELERILAHQCLQRAHF